jgi:DNA-binding GntR family transcriptional regulator
MRKPVSKHALRRALERVVEEGRIQLEEPTGTVVDRLWHEIEKEMYGHDAKKPVRQPASA